MHLAQPCIRLHWQAVRFGNRRGFNGWGSSGGGTGGTGSFGIARRRARSASRPSSSASANAAVTVSAGTVSAVSVSPGSASLVAGATQQLVATSTDNTGSAVSGQSFTWKSSDASIVSVTSTGVATAAHSGSATVTATAGSVSGQSTVTVSAGPLSNVTITPASGTVQQGKTENSNVAPAESAVRLVGLMRQFEMLQKAITITSDMNKQALTEVARVGG